MPLEALPLDPKPRDPKSPSKSRIEIDPLLLGVAAAVVYAVTFPRAAAAIFMVPVVLALGSLLMRRGLPPLTVPLGPLLLSAIAFAVWSLMTAAWSASPLASLSKPLYLLGGALGIGVLSALAREAGSGVKRRVATGVLLGVVIGGAFLGIETLTDQAITRFVYNLVPAFRVGQEKHLAIENGVVLAIAENNINRRAAVVTLLLVPAALAAWSSVRPLERWGGLAALATITATILIDSAHQSSQFAIVAAGGALAVAAASPRGAIWLVGGAWCVACLFVVPIVTQLHATNLHKDTNGLFFSARHRIVIWNYTAEQVKKAPFFGVGADATATITEARDHERDRSRAVVEKDGQFTPTAARHAHNGFLQTWYELGGVGAVILTAMGLFGLAGLRTVSARYQPYLLAEFAAIAGMMAFSFGIWQVWFQGAIGMGVLAIVIITAAQDDRAAASEPG